MYNLVTHADISVDIVKQLPSDFQVLRHVMQDRSLDSYTQVYTYISILSFLYGGAFHSDIIRKVNIDKYLSYLNTNLIYFDYDAGRPLIDFVYTKISKHPFWEFFLKKICLHYLIEKQVKVDSDVFLRSIVHFCFPLRYKGVYFDGKSIGTNVSETVMSLDSNVLKECVLFK